MTGDLDKDPGLDPRILEISECIEFQDYPECIWNHDKMKEAFALLEQMQEEGIDLTASERYCDMVSDKIYQLLRFGQFAECKNIMDLATGKKGNSINRILESLMARISRQTRWDYRIEAAKAFIDKFGKGLEERIKEKLIDCVVEALVNKAYYYSDDVIREFKMEDEKREIVDRAYSTLISLDRREEAYLITEHYLGCRTALFRR